MKLVKVLGGLQDLLVKGFNSIAEARQKVKQERNGKEVELNYINIDTLPAVGQLGSDDFVSIRDFILQNSGGGGAVVDYVTLDVSGFNLSNNENDTFILHIDIDNTNRQLTCQNTDSGQTVSTALIGPVTSIVSVALNGIILDKNLVTVTNNTITIDFNANHSPVLIGPKYTETNTLVKAFGYKHIIGICYTTSKTGGK